MDAKAWLKWAFIFLVLGSFSIYVFYPIETVPLASAYSYEDAMGKIDWNTVKNNSILIYTTHSDFIGRNYGNGEFAIWQPAQENFDKFIKTKCNTFEKINKGGKTLFVFIEMSGTCFDAHAFDKLSFEVKEAYKNLKKKETRGVFSKQRLVMTPNHMS
jgi:hypothetical protein